MGNKNPFYALHFQSQPVHPDFGFGTGEAGIDENSFFIVADIVTITVASRI
jgi:hypothetical protein